MDQKQYEAELKDLEVKLDRLRSLFDQYFRGIEKLPPTVLKKDVERKIRNLTKIRMKNTALRFRLQVQIQKYTTFLAYWQRMLREIEDGKHKRGRFEDDAAISPRGYAGKTRPKKKQEDILDLNIDLDE